MVINQVYLNPQKDQEESGIVSSEQARSKTTCELYYSVDFKKLRASVQSALFHYLHHGPASRKELSSICGEQKGVNINLIDKIKENFKDSSIYFFLKNQFRNRSKCDVIFNFVYGSKHCLGVQRKLAAQCQLQGLRTGIVGQVYTKGMAADFDDFSTPQELAKLSGLRESSKIHKEIIEQCKYVQSCLEKEQLFKPNSREYLSLAKLASKVEQKSRILKSLLEIKQPKLVILVHGKVLGDTAMQIACSDTATPTMLFPHGFPQKSLSQLTTSYVMSYSPHHDNYLKEMCSPSTKVIEFGWLEPSVTLINACSDSPSPILKQSGKYNVLFLSSLSGWETHRCESLLEHVPDILKTLHRMPEVETIRVRLRPNERNDLVIKTLLAACVGSKLQISDKCSIEDDLRECNLIMSFNSTALLYGPYTNKKAVEIRDRSINSVWGSTVLPNKQVFQIDEKFDPDDFSKFILNSQLLEGEKVFYNHGRELTAFSDCLSKIIQ